MLTLTVRYVNTYNRHTTIFDIYLYRSLQRRHVSALYVGDHQVVIGLKAHAILAC